MMGAKGPELSDAFGRFVLNLMPDQIGRVNKALQTVYNESLADELESLTVEPPNTDGNTGNANRVVVTIHAYPGRVARLENRLWTKLDEILSPDQQSVARLNLHLDPPKMRARR